MIAFDTYNAVKRLMQTGVQEKQAEEFVKIFSEIKDTNLDRIASKEQVIVLEKDVENIREQVATKVDLAKAGTELRTDIGKVRTELKTDIEKAKTELRTDIEKVRTELKTDIEKVKTELRTDIEKVRTELRTDIDRVSTELHQVEKKLISKSHQSERRLMLMMGGSVVAICGFVAAILKYLPYLQG